MRALTRSEKTLLLFCGLSAAVVGLLYGVRDYRARSAAARERIADLEPQLDAAAAAAADVPFWEDRQAWLDATMPKITDSGKDHSAFLEHLQTLARDRGLTIGPPVLLKPERGKHATELAVTMQVSGPDNAVLRWLTELQSPEKLHLIKYVQVASQRRTQGSRLEATVTIARLFQP